MGSGTRPVQTQLLKKKKKKIYITLRKSKTPGRQHKLFCIKNLVAKGTFKATENHRYFRSYKKNATMIKIKVQEK